MKKLLVISVLLLFVLSGCSGIQTGRTKEQAANLADNVHIGTKGVTIEFVKNNPPDVVFTSTPLDIVVELKNEGAGEVVGGTLHLTGYDSHLFNIQPQYQDFNLEARSRFNTFGGFDTASFNAGNVFLPQGTDTLTQNFLASACYAYRTEARVPVCIDPNPTSILENEACKVTNPTLAGGQGGPVSVTAIKTESAPGQTNFLITIANLGDGQVINRESLGKCPTPLNFNDVDSVQYSVRLSGVQGDCKPVQTSRLSNKQGNIFCTFILSDAVSPAYTSILEINLDYGYLSQKTKTVRIRNLN